MIPISVLRELSRSPVVPESSRKHFQRALRDPALKVWPHPHGLGVSTGKRSPGPASALLFDCGSTEALPGRHVSSPVPGGDATIKFVYENLIQALEFFRACFSRESMDGHGLSVLASVHYGHYYTNAFWNGYGLVFGDGDGLIFKSMASSDDFIGHEFMHGVTQHASRLEYSGEAGALNESFSDVFGSLFRQWRAQSDAHAADWMIGSGLMGPTAISNGWYCLRSLKEPSAAYSLSKQPWHYRDYIPGGGPHDNSGIPNHAFYLLSLALGGNAWEKPGMIWYQTLVEITDSKTGFAEFARRTHGKASELYPAETEVAQAVEDVWRFVGVTF